MRALVIQKAMRTYIQRPLVIKEDRFGDKVLSNTQAQIAMKISM